MLMLMLNEVASYLIVGCFLGLLALLCGLVLVFSWRMCTLGRDVEVIDDGMLTTFDGRRINDCCGKWCDAVAFSFCFTVERLEDLLFLQIVGGNLAQEYCSL